ncbi:CHASE2 domain-containing protein [Bradyrhizobium sp. ma5]|uniref:nSTAND1 domain-containing NTPase n=1 Tax=Bradyrhizobium sp. ma5 TaxID=3344828 RepID=UPI0035D49232
MSHSSIDNASAVALKDWLLAHGWDDVFLDIDPRRGIAAGDRWERALNKAALRCEAVLFLVSRAWLASDWCLKEFSIASRLNKRLFGLLIEDIPVSELPAALTGTWQLVPLAAGKDRATLRSVVPGTHDEVSIAFSQEGLMRLRIGLEKAGLDARFFAWPPESDPQRPPYRGLSSLEAEDAGTFFGRDAPMVAALDRIRGMREGAAPRLLVILGASGAGKSSFLRAGLLPRLARDDRAYLVLPVIRPGRNAISGETGLHSAIDRAVKRQGLATSQSSEIIDSGVEGLRSTFSSMLAETRTAFIGDDAAVHDPTLVLAIDQGEELFLGEGAAEGAALLKIVQQLLADDDPAVLVIITIRSDAYEQLQMADALGGVTQQTLSLVPMPRGAYQSVIEGPAARMRDADRPLLVDPALTQALLSDIEDGSGRDALPLLAFTLERLYLEFGGSGRLMFDNYVALGRIRGSIEAAVERALSAAQADPKIPSNRELQLALLRRGLVPWLASIDPDTGSPRRQKARISEIPEESRALIDLLIEQRLLSTDVAGDTGERTIEPAHEALLRQWAALQSWLVEDSAALSAFETVKRACRDWVINGKSEDWLAHRARRLADTKQLLQQSDLDSKLDTSERDYLDACTDREAVERKRTREELARREHLESSLDEATSLPQLTLLSKCIYGVAACICIAAIVLIRVVDPSFVQAARRYVFDSYQWLDTQPVESNLAQVLAVDNASLARIGEWPWPRTVWSDVVAALTNSGALAIGFTVLFTESDRMSPELQLGPLAPDRSHSVGTMSDETFALAIKRSRVVLATIPISSESNRPPKLSGLVLLGEDGRRHLYSSPGFLRNLEALENAADGVGHTGVRTDSDGVVRRLPLAWRDGQSITIPSLELELLRVVSASPAATISSDRAGINWIGLRGLHILTDANGAVYPRFHVSDPQSFLSVEKLLAGQINTKDIAGRIILIGVTADGLSQRVRTSAGDVHGVDMYRQVLLNILTQRLLWRPSFALPAEVLITLLTAVVLAFVLLSRGLASFVLVVFMAEALMVFAGWFAYSKYAMLFDVSYPSLVIVFASPIFVLSLYLRINSRRLKGRAKIKELERRFSLHRSKLEGVGDDR